MLSEDTVAVSVLDADAAPLLQEQVNSISINTLRRMVRMEFILALALAGLKSVILQGAYRHRAYTAGDGSDI